MRRAEEDLGYQQAIRYAEELKELYAKERARTGELEAAQAHLRRAEAKYRSLVEQLPAIVYEANFGPTGTWHYVSRQIETILGFTPEEWIADPELWFRQVHPDDRAQALEDERASRDKGPTLSSEYRMLSRDGRVVWFRDEASVVPGDAGHTSFLQGFMLDITERKLAEEALRRHTERLESLRKIDLAILAAESVEDLIQAALTRLQSLVPSERATVSLLDQEAGEITVFASTHTGETAFAKGTRLPLEALGAIGAEVIDALRKAEVFVHQDISRLEDASPALVTAQAEGVRSVLSAPLLSQGKLIGILGLTSPDPGAFHAEHVEIAGEVANQLAIAMRQAQLFDELKAELAERRRAEEEMSRSEARKSAILEAALDCVITIDHEGKVVEFNPAAERTFGYRREEIVGKEMAELIIPPAYRRAHREGLARYLTTGDGPVLGKRLELAAMRADGTEFPVELAITRVDLPGPPLFTGYLRDITDRKRAEEELRQTDEQRQRLLSRLVNAQEEERSRIAGDIHGDSIQVMSAVGMRLEVLSQALEDPRQRALLEQLDGTVRQAIGRLRNLLFELRPPVLDREGLVPALRIYLQQNPGDQGTDYNLDDRVTIEPPPETRVILYRIAQEALTNVRKHARASTVVVLLEERDGGFVVRITDNGIGFTLDEGARSGPSQLGLAALKERAEMAGGRCRIESAPGVGATVEVWVPGPPQEEEAAS